MDDSQDGERAPRPRTFDPRAIAVAVIALLGTYVFADIVHEHYPIDTWFAWPWLMLLGYTLTFQVACVSVGARLLAWCLGPRRLPLLETWVAAMGFGLVAFVFALYLAGAVRMFVTPVAVLMPVLAIVAGGRAMVALLRRTAEQWPKSEGTPARRRLTLSIATGAGVVGMVLLYGISFTPDAISFDAQWYHMTIAQDFARTGRIMAFPADYNRAFPHLPSMVYTWGYLLPGLSMPLQWMMALHLEFAMVVWKLVGIAALAQWMLGDERRRGLWLAMFLFPALFAFGNAVGGGAEHFLAFWAAPMLTSTARMLEDDFDPRHAIMLGLFAGGATLTKYQAIYMVVGCGTVIAARWIVVMIVRQRSRRRDTPVTPLRNLWLAPLLVIATTTLVSAPHFVGNVVLYHNPLYPFAQDVFGGLPTHADAADLWRTMLGEEDNHPTAHGTERLRWTAEIFATFTFEPHYTVGWVKPWPLFGSLFTLLLPCAFFVRGSRRIWIGIWCCFVAVAIWGNTYLTDRYLNAVVPIFAAVTAALLVRIGELGRLARFAVLPIVALQLLWSGDAAMYSGEKLLGSTMELWSSGWRGETDDDERFGGFASFRAITAATPPDARILLRGSRPSLGLDREVWLDLQWAQAALYYRPITDARGLWQLYRDSGITHLVWRRNVHYSGTLQSTVLFAQLVHACGTTPERFGGYDMIPLCDTPPAPTAPVRVLTHRQRLYRNGLYHVEDLHAFGRHSKTEREHVAPRTAIDYGDAAELGGATDQTDVVLVARPSKVSAEMTKRLRAEFTRFEALDNLEVWLRTTPASTR